MNKHQKHKEIIDDKKLIKTREMQMLNKRKTQINTIIEDSRKKHTVNKKKFCYKTSDDFNFINEKGEILRDRDYFNFIEIFSLNNNNDNTTPAKRFFNCKIIDSIFENERLQYLMNGPEDKLNEGSWMNLSELNSSYGSLKLYSYELRNQTEMAERFYNNNIEELKINYSKKYLGLNESSVLMEGDDALLLTNEMTNNPNVLGCGLIVDRGVIYITPELNIYSVSNQRLEAVTEQYRRCKDYKSEDIVKIRSRTPGGNRSISESVVNYTGSLITTLVEANLLIFDGLTYKPNSVLSANRITADCYHNYRIKI